MEDFLLQDDKRNKIDVLPGLPPEYIKEYGLPNAEQRHAYYGKYPMLFQAVRCGKYEIAISDYLINCRRKLICFANVICLELHFILTGKAYFNLKDLGWQLLDEMHHNMIALSKVKNEVRFKFVPVSTFDIHFPKEEIIRLAKKYPQLQPLLEALKAESYASLFALVEETTPEMLLQIVKIKEAIKAGKANDKETIDMIEALVIMVLENKPAENKYKYRYAEIESIHKAHRLIEQYLDEKDILSNKMKETGLNPDKFRKGFLLLYGLLPSEYLLGKRMEKADLLIKEKRVRQLQDIAVLCGFKSKEQLSQNYLRKNGVKISDAFTATNKGK